MAEAKPILMPKLGQTVEESTIVKWHKAEGDAIAKGEVIFEIETDKAVLESEAFASGTLLKILVPEGGTVPVQSVVAYMGAPGDTIPVAPPPPPPAPKKEEAAPAKSSPASAPPAKAAVPATASLSQLGSAPVAPPPPQRKTISPRAKKLCRDRVVHWEGIKGSGPGGRIVEADVRAYLEAQNYEALRITPTALQMAADEGLDVLALEGRGEGGRIRVEDIERAVREKPQPMSRMRQVIAQRLTASFRDIPHFFVTVSADMTDLMELRKSLKTQGRHFSVNDFIMEAVILSLKEFDALNSMTPDGVRIKWNSRVNLGMAVSVDNGLVVPVIRGAEELSLSELHERAAELAAKARDGKLAPDDMRGGTFTISNMGMLGVEQFNAIINPGESAILAVSAAIPTPVVVKGQVVIRNMMKMTLSADHRIVDGATGAKFATRIKALLENMDGWRRLVA